MPKKFAGENSKATMARARKETVRIEKREKEAAAKENAYWADDNKQAQRKQQRKEEEERKRQQALERKQQNKEAYEAEMRNVSATTSARASSSAATKVTLAQLQARREAEERARAEEEARRRDAASKLSLPNTQLEENLNRLEIDGDVATNVTSAIRVLDAATGRAPLGGPEELHPEKRVRAAYAAFEERRLPQLKTSHPTLRLSQLKQLLKKEWQKSPENPLNEKIMSIIKG